MSDPREPSRLRDDAALHAVLDSAALDDDDDAVKRIGARLGLLPIAPPATVSPPTAPSAGTAAAGAGSIWKIGVLVSVIAIGTAGLAWQASTRASSAPAAPPVVTQAMTSPATAVTPTPDATPIPLAEPTPVAMPGPELPAPAPQPVREGSPRRAAPAPEHDARETAVAPRAEPSRGSLAEEIRMIEQIRALLPHDPDAALALADEHRARFPDGRLQTERERLEDRARSLAAR